MRTLLIAGTVALAGCATEGGGRMGLFSATAPLIAIIQDDLFTGEVEGYMDRTGSIKVQSAIHPEIQCVGQFSYTGSKTGVARLQCNDGATATLSFNAISMLSGYGFGTSTRGPASFTYGLTPEQSMQYLKLPANKRLVRQPDGKPWMESI